MECGQRVKKYRVEHWQKIALYLIIYDVIVANASYFVGLLLRFDFQFSSIPREYLIAFIKFAPLYSMITVEVFAMMRLYNSLWRFASFSELNRISAAWGIMTTVHIVGITLLFERMPISYYIFGAIIQLFMTVVVRFGYRFVNMERSRRDKIAMATQRVMIIGAGECGQAVLKELKTTSKLSAVPCCVIDDNPNKWNRLMEGVPIVGGREEILNAVEKYKINLILFAIPSATPKQRKSILNICKESSCELKSFPGLYQVAKGEVVLSKMKHVAVDDLLGRDPIKVNMEEIFQYIKGKTILVTGGGGSIGSELCRQVAEHEPKQLIIYDIYENNAYEIEQELKRKYKDKLNLVVLIGSVRDTKRINEVFEEYAPDIVYHAAAHKHVPLMETSPNEAIKNNVIGTYKTACAAMKYGAQRFVLISTDKAVNPTNIMGASKRICEMVIQSLDAISRSGRLELLPSLDTPQSELDKMQEHFSANSEMMCDLKVEAVKNKEHKGTQFVAVRFGNVLGSNGSVIPLFKKQIEAGGPVTVTHKDIVRYFMTIPEAVSLVLQAGTYAWGGEIFVLDMGEPVKIDTLARNLIKLSGHKPDVDIPIVYTGLRPGEKLYEEKLMAEEGLMKTDNALIHIGKPIPFDPIEFLKQLQDLAKASYENNSNIVKIVEEMVSTFHPVGEILTGNEKS